jgi:DNA-binding response OmpR family regulator
MSTHPRVLVVEDEANIRDLVCLHLGLEGYSCVPAGDGKEALRLATEQAFDLIVLDLMIPGLDGITVCRAIRRDAAQGDVPILMLTARREETDKVLGLESGADDYLTKPFGVRELVARARALLRRPRRAPVGAVPLAEEGLGGGRPPSTAAPHDRPLPGWPARDARIAAHGIEIDLARRLVRVGGRPIELTNQEFMLLVQLSRNPGIVFSREALLARVWSGETHVTVRSVDTLVKRLRHKIETDSSAPRFVLTVWGVGYKWVDV